ncbi:unnamed protein product, partial [Hapterophycus canaliculatus]
VVRSRPETLHLAATLGPVRLCAAIDRTQGGLRPWVDKIEALEWASDSDLLLCAMYKRSLVEVQGATLFT